MGGTGGPGSDRTAAQSGLQGAGLLSGGGGPEAPSATKTALGVEGAAQPSTGMLAGTDGAIGAPPGPTSASDTPPVTPAVPEVIAPPTTGYIAPSTSTVTPPALATAPTFTLAGSSNLGFPSGVTDDNPFGTTTHVPFGTQETPAVSGPAIAAPPVVAAAPAPAPEPEYEFDMDAFLRDGAAYNAANAAWGKPGLRPDAFANVGKTWMKLKGT